MAKVRAFARLVGARPAANEGDIHRFEHAAIEAPVSEILTRLLNVGPNVCNSAGPRFTTNNRELNNGAVDEEEEVPNRRQSRPRKGVATEYEVKGTFPDGLGFRVRQGEKENLAFVFNYKAAHKLAVQNLQPALANDRLFMDVIQRVNGSKLPTDSKLRAREDADRQVAMALTQVFSYMIECGVSYGYVTGGKGLVLLHVELSDLQMLYYHLCAPNEAGNVK